MTFDREPVESSDEATTEADPPLMRYGAMIGDSRGQTVLHTSADGWLDVATAAHGDGFDQLIDVTAVDFLTHAGPRRLPGGIEPERFEVVANLISHARRERVRLRAQVPADDPTIPTLFDIWPGAEAMEREAFDMFGIVFAGHPDHSRILMPDDWEGYPLRKDFDTGAIPVRFKAASNVR